MTTEVSTDHVELVLVVHEGRHDEGGDCARGEAVVGVEDGAVLVPARSQGRVEGRPEEPEEHRAW